MRRFALARSSGLPRRSIAITLALVLALSGARSLQAQSTAATPTYTHSPFALRADWLQGNSALTRSTMPSNALAIAYEGQYFGASAGFLRIARDMSTVEGGTLGVEAGYRAGRFRVSLGANAMIGVAMASMDTTGYQYVSSGGTTGHTPRWDYSRTSANGFGGTVTMEYDFFEYLGLRVTGGSWSFTGAPLGNEKTRTTIGAGLAVPFGGLKPAARRTP